MENSTDFTHTIQEFIDVKCSIDGKVMEKCLIAVEAKQSINWKKHFRIIGVLRKRTEYAVVMFTGKKIANQTLIELKVIDALPFNSQFTFELDQTRFCADDYYPLIITGEDFTIGDLDPLITPCNSINNDLCVSGKKKFNFDMHKCDYDRFSNQINIIKDFANQQESFSSFDWLNKIRDDSDSISDTMTATEKLSNDSENEEKAHSENQSPKSKELIGQNHTMDLSLNLMFPSNNIRTIKGNNSSSHLDIDSTRNSNSYNQQSMSDLNKSSRQRKLKQKELKNLSTPDLLDGLEDSKSRFSFYNTMSGDTQNAYIESKMKKREEDYCKWEDHNMFVGTWNVNGMRVEDNLDLDVWLKPPDRVSFPSLYVLGFQELDLSVSSMALNRGTTNFMEEKWLRAIESSLPFRKKQYKRVYRMRLAGILLIVYIDLKLAKYVPDEEVVANKVPTGMFGVMGNKGGVGIRFQIFNSNLVFINCHLAAGENNRPRRDQDFRDIERQMIFNDDPSMMSSFYDDNDLVFLMGDLNYRLNNIDAAVARDLAMKNKVDMLMSRDELTMLSHSVFKRFHEGKIEFLPTYKFEIHKDEYDTSEKNRVPSYCDRIMWYGERCRQLKYSSIMELKTSDHKPVYSWFKIGLKKIDFQKQLKVQESIIRSVDLLYNLSLPQAKVDRQEIHFEEVHFYEHRQASISVTNIGQYEFIYRFKEIPGSPRIPDWLTVQPCEGRIDPGKECELIFEIFINVNNVSQLNTQSDVQCILVLDLQGGKDYFITVSADLIPTSFGLPLSLLSTLKEPVATLTRKQLFDKCKMYIQRPAVPVSSNTSSANAFTTPKEIYVMIDYLMTNVKEEELFARPGCHTEIQNIREQLDTKGANADFSAFSVHSTTEALLMFLNSLYFPIIPNELSRECLGVYNNFDESVKVIAKLPMDHQNLFHYLTSFLRKVLDNKTSNGTDINSLAILFVDLIFRPKNLETNERDICAHFICQFLRNDPVKYIRNLRTSINHF